MESKPKYTLAELLAGITPENRHELIDSGPPVGREFGGPFEGAPYSSTSGGHAMKARVRKVDGGYELFIPDEEAERAGITADASLEVNVAGYVLLARNPEFVERMYAAIPAYSGPLQYHDPHEPYDPPVGFEREGR